MPTEKPGTLREKFQQIAKQIKETAVDFTTVEVTTVTGNIRHLVNTDKTKFNVKDIVKEMGQSGRDKFDIKVVAHTNIDFDHDTIIFLKEELTPQEKDMFVMHQSAMASSLEARKSFLNFLREVLDE